MAGWLAVSQPAPQRQWVAGSCSRLLPTSCCPSCRLQVTFHLLPPCTWLSTSCCLAYHLQVTFHLLLPCLPPSGHFLPLAALPATCRSLSTSCCPAACRFLSTSCCPACLPPAHHLHISCCPACHLQVTFHLLQVIQQHVYLQAGYPAAGVYKPEEAGGHPVEAPPPAGPHDQHGHEQAAQGQGPGQGHWEQGGYVGTPTSGSGGGGAGGSTRAKPWQPGYRRGEE